MTYALAWKSRDAVFLAADSVLTVDVDPTDVDSTKLPFIKESSFGQKHIQGDSKKVEERAVKLFLKENIGITFAGRYGLAIQVAKSFYEKIKEGFEPEEALGNALFLNSPFPKGADLQIAVAYYNSKPQLLYYNSLEGSKVNTDKRIVHMGSIPEPIKKLNQEWISHIDSRIINSPRQLLASQLGFLQSSNIFNSLLDVGIGGAFSGLYVDRGGGSWQPDIIFIEDDKHVSTCFRHDCLVINSPVIGQNRCFLTYLPPKSKKDLLEQCSKAVQKGMRLRDGCEFEYAVISGKKGKPLVLIEMNRENRHRMIWLEHFLDKTNGSSGTDITKFPELREIFRKYKDQAKMFYFPFQKPVIQQIPDDQKFIREINNN